MKVKGIWLKKFNAAKNKRVLLLFSGGKDSTLCLFLLREIGIDVTPIIFTHNWGWDIPLKEAKKSCQKLGIKLQVFDFSTQFRKIALNKKFGRPCKYCKQEIYKLSIDFAKKNGFGWICVGDNMSDTTKLRLSKASGRKNNLEISRFLSSFEKESPLPKNINILRPIISFSSNEVEAELLKRKVKVQKVHETGDKYFEFWREGCPMQYNDPGTPLTIGRMNALLKFNKIATKFARKNNIRASVHLPSKKIVTIPSNFEKKLEAILKENGFKPKKEQKKTPRFVYFISIKRINIYYLIEHELIGTRIIELLKSDMKKTTISLFKNNKILTFLSRTQKMIINLDSSKNVCNIIIESEEKLSRNQFKFWIFQIFKTNDFEIFGGY